MIIDGAGHILIDEWVNRNCEFGSDVKIYYTQLKQVITVIEFKKIDDYNLFRLTFDDTTFELGKL